ncbi:MAG TPA: hypothetical protein VFZ91_02545 [Allosphingosinicella sp.]
MPPFRDYEMVPDMIAAMPFAAAAAAMLSSAPIPPGALPSQAELEAALLAYNVRLAAHPLACQKGLGCIKPPKAIKVRDYDCQTRGTDAKGNPVLFCRVTYVHKGGSLDHVKSPNECVPLRASEMTTIDDDGTKIAWAVAMIDSKGRCPGARE